MIRRPCFAGKIDGGLGILLLALFGMLGEPA